MEHGKFRGNDDIRESGKTKTSASSRSINKRSGKALMQPEDLPKISSKDFVNFLESPKIPWREDRSISRFGENPCDGYLYLK